MNQTDTIDTTAETPADFMYTVADAAEYLGVTESCVRYHIYTTGNLVPDENTMRVLRFHKTTLDAFRNTHMAEGYTVREAAEYLGVPVTTIRMHVYTLKRLAPDARRGNSHVFYKATLDAFAATHLQKTEYRRPPSVDEKATADRRRRYHEPNPVVLTASPDDIEAIIDAL